MDNISVQKTLADGIVHEKRVSVKRRVLRAVLCMTGEAGVAHKLMNSAKVWMTSLPCSAGYFVTSKSFAQGDLSLASTYHDAHEGSYLTFYVMSEEENITSVHLRCLLAEADNNNSANVGLSRNQGWWGVLRRRFSVVGNTWFTWPERETFLMLPDSSKLPMLNKLPQPFVTF